MDIDYNADALKGEYTWRITRFSKSKFKRRSLRSPVFQIGKDQWLIELSPCADGPAEALRVSLVAVADSTPPPPRRGWTTQPVQFTLTIHNQKNEKRSVVREWDHQFQKGRSLGWLQFMPLARLENTRKGFLVDDTLVVSAKVVVHSRRQREAAEARVEALEREARARDAAVAELRRRQGDAAAIEPLSMEQLELLQSETKDALSRIEARVRELNREARYCHICLERPKDTVFQCGHTTCAACAEQVWLCPHCRTPITAMGPLFL